MWLDRDGTPEGIDPAFPLLRDARARVRAVALSVVGKLRSATGVTLESASREVAATEGYPDAVPLLIERVINDQSINMRRQAVSLLG